MNVSITAENIDAIVTAITEASLNGAEALLDEAITEVVETPEVEEVSPSVSVDWQPQPQEYQGSYEANSEVLRAYAHANPVQIFVPMNATKMVITLKKSIDPKMTNPRIILYREK